MSDLTDLTFEDEPNDIYKGYLGYITTNTESSSFALLSLLDNPPTARNIKADDHYSANGLNNSKNFLITCKSFKYNFFKFFFLST
jgi:hypothetical protein